jgi:hypothetical protein
MGKRLSLGPPRRVRSRSAAHLISPCPIGHRYTASAGPLFDVSPVGRLASVAVTALSRRLSCHRPAHPPRPWRRMRESIDHATMVTKPTMQAAITASSTSAASVSASGLEALGATGRLRGLARRRRRGRRGVDNYAFLASPLHPAACLSRAAVANKLSGNMGSPRNFFHSRS